MTMTPVRPTPASRPPPAFMPWYLKPGDHIDQYELCTAVGEGSGGVVYEVKDPAGARFALKLSRFPLAPTGRPSVICDRFQLSAMAHLALNDVPNVAKLFGFNTLQTPQGAFPYLVMELVPGGETITEWAKRTSPSLAKLVSVFIDTATAVGALADNEICHRDLKPQNILIAPGDIPKIVDFNSVAFPLQKTITYPAASAIPGTLAYFSPELAKAVLAEFRTRIQERYAYAPTDDLYALGAVFYEVLTGEIPCCQLDEPEEVMLRQIAGLQPVRLYDLNPSIPWPIGKVVTKLLRKDPRERYQSGHEVAADLQAAYRGTADKNWQVPFIVGPCEANPTLPLWLVPSTPVAPVDLSTEKGPPPSTPAPDAPASEPKEMLTCHILYIEGSGLPEARREPEPAPAEGEAEAAEASRRSRPTDYPQDPVGRSAAGAAENAPAGAAPGSSAGAPGEPQAAAPAPAALPAPGVPRVPAAPDGSSLAAGAGDSQVAAPAPEVAPSVAEAPSEGDSSAAPPVTGPAAEWQPLAEPDGSRAAHAGRPAAGVRARLERAWRFLRKFAERFGRASWKPIIISAGSGALVGCLVVLVAPLLAGAAKPGPLMVVVFNPAGDKAWRLDPRSLLEMPASWGEKPLDQTIPDFTLPGQKAAPCDARWGERTINGNCWVWIADVKPPCGLLFRQGDKCFRPVAAEPKKPAP